MFLNAVSTRVSGMPVEALEYLLSALPITRATAQFKPPDIPSSPSDCMDVDMAFNFEVPARLGPPVPLSAAPTVTSSNNLFFDTMSLLGHCREPVPAVPEEALVVAVLARLKEPLQKPPAPVRGEGQRVYVFARAFFAVGPQA
ncbi:hypothetical protein OH77DRAFT_1526047 [Trametes cingulata]|nr:hypothetical protein OH77DRAFT_1526047 [Trametes cingulata]